MPDFVVWLHTALGYTPLALSCPGCAQKDNFILLFMLSLIGALQERAVSKVLASARSAKELVEGLEGISTDYGFDVKMVLAEIVLCDRRRSIEDFFATLLEYNFLEDRAFLKDLPNVINKEELANGLGHLEKMVEKVKGCYLVFKYGLPSKFYHYFCQQLELMESMHNPSNSSSLKCPFASRMSGVGKKLPEYSFEYQFSDTEIISGRSSPATGWLVERISSESETSGHQIGVTKEVSADINGDIYCLDDAFMKEDPAKVQLGRLRGHKLRLGPAELVNLGRCIGMVPSTKAARIAQIAPYLLRMVEPEEAFAILKRLLNESIEYPGPYRIPLLLEESKKCSSMSDEQFTTHVKNILPTILESNGNVNTLRQEDGEDRSYCHPLTKRPE